MHGTWTAMCWLTMLESEFTGKRNATISSHNKV